MTQIDRRFRLARIWSNAELQKIAPLCTGDVVNVSAGEDIDKQGGTYRDYFPGCRSYSLTNQRAPYRGFEGRPGEIELDLTGSIPSELQSRFDVVFNHTTLEHIFEVGRAFDNLCSMSRDLVILVVPFSQIQHENEGYEDFWRFTPTCVRRLFADSGFEVVYETESPDTDAAIYLFFAAARDPEKWRALLSSPEKIQIAGEWIGAPSKLGILRPLAAALRRMRLIPR